MPKRKTERRTFAQENVGYMSAQWRHHIWMWSRRLNGGEGRSYALPVIALTLALAGCDLRPLIGEVSRTDIQFDTLTPINSQNKSSYTLKGSCTSGPVAINLGTAVRLSLPCTGGRFEKTLNLSGLPDGQLALIGGVAAKKSTTATSILKDTDPPLISVAATQAPWINQSTAPLYVVDGTCSEEHQPVEVVIGSVSAKATCSSGTFSVALDTTTLADGPLTISAFHSDDAGNTGTGTFAVQKDVVPPAAVLVTGLPAGQSATVSPTGTVSGTDVTQYSYLFGPSLTTTCLAVWSYSAAAPVATTLAPDLSSTPNGFVRVCVRGADAAGNWISVGSAYSTIWEKIAPNIAPAINVTSCSTTASEDTAYACSPVITDADGPSLTVSFAGSHTCGPWLSVNSTTGALSGTPLQADAGTCTVAITATDGSLSDTKSYSLTVNAVNDAPTLNVASCATTVAQDAAYACSPVTTDPDNASFTYAFAGTHTCGPWLSVNGTTGALSGTPGDNDVGACTIAVTVNDGAATQTSTIAFTVTNVAPTLTIANAAALLRNAPATEIRDNAAVQASEEGYGVYTFDHAGTTGTKCSDNSLQLAIDATTGSITYRPATNYVGTCNIRVVFDDQNGAGNSTVAAQFSITVNDLILSIANITVAEDVSGGKAVLTASIPANAYQDVTFDFSTADGTAVSSGVFKDFDSTSQTGVTITAGTSSVQFEVPLTNDGRDEPDQAFTVTLANPTGATIGTGTATVTITDEDAAPTLTLGGTQTVVEDVGTVALTATLSIISEKTVTASFASTDGTAVSSGIFKDFDAASTAVSIAPGSLTQNLSVTITDDPRDEDDQAFTAALTAPGNATLGTSTATITLQDNDSPPTVSLSYAEAPPTEGQTAKISATLSVISEKAIGLTATTSDGTATTPSDYTALVAEPVSIAAGTLTVQFNLVTADDAVTCEEGETVHVAAGGYTNVTAGATTTLDVTITENDYPGVTLTASPIVEGQSAVVKATLSTMCPNYDVPFVWKTVSGTATVGEDLATQSGTVTIAKNTLGNTFTVSTTDDTTAEPNEVFGLVAAWGTYSSGSGNVLITDNDLSQTVAGIGVSKVSVGSNTTCAVLTDGNIKCWGGRFNGLIPGDDASLYGNKPSEVVALAPKVPFAASLEPVEIGLGGGFGCARMTNGSVRCYGNFNLGPRDNADSNMGGRGRTYLGTEYEGTKYGSMAALPPVNLGNGRTATQLAVGYFHACAILDNAKVRCWGAGHARGVGTTGHTNYEADMGDNLPDVDFGTGLTATKISAGNDFTCALLSDQSVKCWGSNGYGQLGIGNTLTIGDGAGEMGNSLAAVPLGQNVLDLGVGHYFACARLQDKSVKCWGDNAWGQLGLGHISRIGDSAGEVAALTGISLGTGVLAEKLAVTQDSVCVLTDSNTVKCWGRNDVGQLGIGTTSNIGDGGGEMGNALVSVPLGQNATDVWMSAHNTCAKLADNSVKCWGANSVGQLGIGSANHIGDGAGEVAAAAAIDPGANYEILGISHAKTSGYASGGLCYLLRNTVLNKNEARCFGDNRNGRLGLENMYIGDGPGEMGAALPTLKLGTGLKAVDVQVLSGGVCALFSNQKVKCWGRYEVNGAGSSTVIGTGLSPLVGDSIPYVNFGTGANVIKIDSHLNSTCGLLTDGRLKCFGYNSGWQMGYNATFSSIFGDAAGEVGDNMQVLNFGAGRKVVDFSVGNTHTCAILDNGKLKCVGNNYYGQLGLGHNLTMGDSALEVGDSLADADLGTSRTAQSISVGVEASFAILDNGSAVAWGSNDYYQLGTRTTHIGDGSGEMGNALAPINWGIGLTAKKFIAGRDRGSCAILSNDTLKCWGINGYNSINWGRLGKGTTGSHGNAWDALSDKYSPINIGTGLKVKEASTSTHTCTVTTDERLKCFGWNYDGRLGLEDQITRGDNPGEMGDSLPFVDLGLTAGAGPASFIISGVTGGSDATADSLLGHTEPTIQWSASTGAVDYLVTIVAADQSTVSCAEQTTASTTFSFIGCTLTSGSQYYARVIARDGSANTKAAANSLFPFTVDTVAPAAFLVSGVSGDTDTTVDAALTDGVIPTITWTVPEGGAGRFDVTIYENDGVTSKCATVAKLSGNTSHRFASCALTQGATYLARVVAFNPNGTQSTEASNSLFSFTVGDTSGPAAFTISGITGEPNDEDFNTVLSGGSLATVNWADTTGEDSYDVTLFESDGTTVKCATSNVPADQTEKTFTGCHLSGGATYVATVVAKDAFSSTPATNSPFTFTVATTPGSFDILGVQGGAFDTTTDANLSDSNIPTILWSASTGATAYSVSVRTLDGNTICSSSVGVTTSTTLNGCYLEAATSYRAYISASGTGTTTATNNGYLFTVADYPVLSVNRPLVTEGQNATFNVTASKVWSQDLTVNYRTAGLRADPNLDFTPTTGTVTILAGQTTANFSIATRDDSTLEVDETFTVSLYQPSNAALSKNSIGLATIQDNEAPNASAPVMVKVGGNNFSCGLFQDGRVKCWGDTAYSQLGHPYHLIGDEPGETGDNVPAVDLGVGFNVAQAISGWGGNNGWSCARSTTGVIKCWGDGSSYGIRGTGAGGYNGLNAGTMGASVPTIDLGDTATAIYGGGGFACAQLTGGGVKCWGRNDSGRLGLGDSNHRGDNPGEMGASLPYLDFGTGRTVTQMSVGTSHSCAILDNGDLKCWGENNYGQLGLGNTNHRGDAAGEMGDALPAVNLGTGRTAKFVSAGYLATCAILDNDFVKCWGYNGYAQLGNGNTNTIGDGPGEMGDALAPVAGLGTVKKVAVGGNFTCAIKSDDSTTCWGDSGYGKLGRGGGASATVRLGTGLYATDINPAGGGMCARLNNNAVKCWGANFDGRLGLGRTDNIGDSPDDMGDLLPSVDLGTGLDVLGVSVAADSKNVCFVASNNAVKCFGDSRYGGTGRSLHYIGDEPGEMGAALKAIDFGTTEKVVDIVLGNVHGCAIFETGRVKCWGEGGSYNSGPSGSIGDYVGEVASSPFFAFGINRKALSIASGDNHTCVLTDDFEVYCVGYGSDGRLANGYADHASSNDNLNIAKWGTGRRVLQLTAGQTSTCAMLDDFTVKCFGPGSGRLGQGDTTTRGHTAGTVGDAVPPIKIGTGRTAASIAATYNGTCAVLDTGALKCWGWDNGGTLGNYTSAMIGDSPAEMGDALISTPIGTTISSVSGQFSNFCALMWNGTGSLAKCWGYGSVGENGIGNGGNVGDAAGEVAALTGISLGTGREPVSAIVNNGVGCALLDNNTVKCWGEGTFLGTGSTFNRGDGAGEMGDSLPVLDLGL
ncbi:MAG: putative Ig domain-containing protein [Bdellovibrionaceae bacterium]|nr:putative Ig domain-containing protein [Pseudobdellovibrionaceae bacterium]